MSASLPVSLSPEAFELYRRLARRMKQPDSLLLAAASIAAVEDHDVDAASVVRTIDDFAATIRGRVRGAQPQALIAHLHEFLFDDMGFKGNAEEYYTPANSYLHKVIEMRTGLPITLSLLYCSVARRLGLKAHGIGLPGHFLAAVETGESAMLVDPFDGGRLLTAEEASERIKQTAGEEFEISEEMLRPVSPLHWLTRIIQNLLNVFTGTEQYLPIARLIEIEMMLWPRQQRLGRDLALVLARLGRGAEASAWLNKYLSANPEDPQREELVQLLAALSQ